MSTKSLASIRREALSKSSEAPFAEQATYVKEVVNERRVGAWMARQVPANSIKEDWLKVLSHIVLHHSLVQASVNNSAEPV